MIMNGKDLDSGSCSLLEGTILVLALKTEENNKNLCCKPKPWTRINLGTFKTQVWSINTTPTCPNEFIRYSD
jgi:hypothetical protein